MVNLLEWSRGNAEASPPAAAEPRWILRGAPREVHTFRDDGYCDWSFWKQRYGKVNEHNGWIPRDHWLEAEERQAILDFHERFPLEGYRRLTFMMIDADIAVCSPSSVYRVLKDAGLMERHHTKPSSKGTGF